MKRVVAFGIAIALFSGLPAASAVAANPTTGQPNQSCQSQPSSPGQASSSPGAPFNEPTSTSAGGTAGQVYAGNGVSATQANSTAAVSQYDVACFQVSSH